MLRGLCWMRAKGKRKQVNSEMFRFLVWLEFGEKCDVLGVFFKFGGVGDLNVQWSVGVGVSFTENTVGVVWTHVRQREEGV